MTIEIDIFLGETGSHLFLAPLLLTQAIAQSRLFNPYSDIVGAIDFYWIMSCCSVVEVNYQQYVRVD